MHFSDQTIAWVKQVLTQRSDLTFSTKELAEAVFPGDEESQLAFKKNARGLTTLLPEWVSQGAPFQIYGKTAYRYEWHAPRLRPLPSIDGDAILSALADQRQILERILEFMHRIEAELDLP